MLGCEYLNVRYIAVLYTVGADETFVCLSARFHICGGHFPADSAGY
jgi:hypothetical protein